MLIPSPNECDGCRLSRTFFNVRKAKMKMIKSRIPGSMKSKRWRSNRSGFTLIEIMIVVLILATLLNIALPSLVAARNTSQTNACIGNLKTLQNAKQEWAIDTNQAGTVTPTWTDIEQYVNSTNGSQPLCPTSQQPYDLGAVDEAASCPTYPLTHVMNSW
jgi:prepilin-type N-terminal cleavage/methylation domain-containing protein